MSAKKFAIYTKNNIGKIFANGNLIRQALKGLRRCLAKLTGRNYRMFLSQASVANNNNKKTLTANTTRRASFSSPSQLIQMRFGYQIRPTLGTAGYIHFIVVTLLIISVLNWDKAKQLLMIKVDADEGRRRDTEKGKKQVGFRERKIIEYENRIRQYSTPEKVFRYFATVILQDQTQSTVFMTPVDFLRSIFPGMKQPDGLGLDRYRRYDLESADRKLNLDLEKDSLFYQLSSRGLITFSDYIFLVTLLSTSRHHFEIAFRIFDLNGDGVVDCEEFKMVTSLMRDIANTGSTSNTKSKPVKSALLVYFFGPNMKEKLTIEKFLKFQEELQREVHLLEFKRKNPNEENKITETDFADLLLAYAGYESTIKQKKLRRVKRRFGNQGKGISKEDFLSFCHFLKEINDVDTALTFYHLAGASIDQRTLQHVAKTVALVNLSDHIVDVIFTIFDDDRDNQLSNEEFTSVMKKRLQRGLQKPKDTGFLNLMGLVFKCAQETCPGL